MHGIGLNGEKYSIDAGFAAVTQLEWERLAFAGKLAALRKFGKSVYPFLQALQPAQKPFHRPGAHTAARW